MRDENMRIREKFELSLDGRQIASIVVGALVILGVVFVLGLNVGRQITARQVEAARGGDLEALDRVPRAAAAVAGEAEKSDITFYDQLPRGKPAPPQPEPARPVPPAPVPSTPAPTVAAAAAPLAPAAAPTLAATTAAPVIAAEVRAPSAAPKPPPAAPAPAAAPSAGGPFVVQLAATQNRADAERIAARHRALSPRIEVAEVAGKGRFYRVRAGSFATRPEAERYLAQASRQSGATGFVTASR